MTRIHSTRGSLPGRIEIQRDVPYGENIVGHTSDPQRRILKLDVYKPEANARTCLRPAIILAFGGAFHRGNKRDDAFSMGESKNTSVADYAEMWAGMGFVTFSIDYRLIPEDPHPGTTPALASIDPVGMQRMRAIRVSLGLPPLTDAQLANGVEAGSDDMAMAARFVRDNAPIWKIDPDRIGLWGWSAGARNAINATFVEGFPSAGVVALSPYAHQADLARMLPSPRTTPPLLLAVAERDLPHIKAQAEPMAAYFKEHLPDVELLRLESVDHFYPATTLATSERGDRIPLVDAMTEFFFRTLKP